MVESKKPINNREKRPRLRVPERSATPIKEPTAPRSTSAPTKSNHSTLHIGALLRAGWPFYKKGFTAIRQLTFTKKALITTATIGLTIVGVSIYQHSSATTSQANNPNSVIENLEYQTVLPSGKSIDNLGGWKRISPPGKDPVYAYIDSINGIPISVSQQPLPNSFKDDIDAQVAELAKKFNATTKLDASGTTIYLGMSAKGPQSVILTKNGLLILIKSQEKVDDSAWIDYAKSLN